MTATLENSRCGWTVNDLTANTKRAAIELLNTRVAEGIDLALLSKRIGT